MRIREFEAERIVEGNNIVLKIYIFLFLCSYSFIGYTKENYPQRIISLAPSITEEIYLLNTQDKLIGCTVYCKIPKENKEKVATATDVNIEKVLSLNPDLVLATSLTNIKSIEKLRNLKIRVIIFPQPKDFIQICKQFLELAKLVGKEKYAEEILGIVKKNINSIKASVKNLQKQNIFIQIGAKPLFAATGNSFINDYIEFVGGVNIAKDAKEGIYSREEVLKKNPDIIIITTMGIVGEEEKKIWMEYRSINAVRNNRIYIIDSNKLCSPTPVNFVETLGKIAEILHYK